MTRGRAALAGLLLLSAACSARAPAPRPPAALRVAVSGPAWSAPQPPDPAVSGALDPAAPASAGLLELDASGRLAPGLARWASSPDGGRTWDLRLAQEATGARALADAWRRHVPRHPAGAWLLADVESGPVPVGDRRLRFRLRAPSDDFPHRLTHPWLRLPLPVPSPAVEWVPAPPAGGLFLLRQERVDACRLTEAELAQPVAPPGLACAAGAAAYHLILQGDAAGSVPGRGPFLALDRARLARRAAPATGRPLAAPGGGARAGAAAGAGAPPPLLVDAGDAVAVALADQIQADLLEMGVELEVRPEAPARYAELLRGGRYGAALAGLRPVFARPELDRLAWRHATGGDEGVLARAIPLVGVDDCWAWRRPSEAGPVLRRLAVPPVGVRP